MLQGFGSQAWGGGRIDGTLMGVNLGVDYSIAPNQKGGVEQAQAKRVVDQWQAQLKGRDVVAQEEKTYEVRGREVTTPYNLRLEALEVKGERLQFQGDAVGIFTPSANPLQRARLRTKDLQLLRSRGTLFFFDFQPNCFQLRFYDPDNTEAPLGVLRADAVPPAGNPGCGAGKWCTSF